MIPVYRGEKIWIDDMRSPPDNSYRWCQTYDSAIATIHYFSTSDYGIERICFDHDLGEEKTGYDIAKYLVKNGIYIENYSVHSMNPVGRQNIIQLLDHYGYKELIKNLN